MIYLIEADAYDPAIPGVRTLRWSSEGYVTRPTDTPANTVYEPRVQQPGLLRLDAWEPGALGGTSRAGYGEIVLANPDGGLDWLADLQLAGHPVRVLVGAAGAAYVTFVPVLSGTLGIPALEWRSVSLRVRDKTALLDEPLQRTKFAGSNALPNGLEGVADLAGRPKPLLFGRVRNIAPPCVNTSRLIYQVHDGGVATVTAAYDRGVPLTKGADYTSEAAMETTAPSAGQFRVWPAGGCFRLGSRPAGTVTCDADSGGAVAMTAGQTVQAVALEGGIPSGEISAADVAALDAAQPAIVGVWLDSETTGRAVLDELCSAVGAWWHFDAAGVLRARRLEAPGGSPVATLTDVEIVRIERLSGGDVDLPVWRVEVGYRRYYTVQPDLASSVNDDRRADLALEYRTAAAESTAIKTTAPLARTLQMSTALAESADASAEAARLLALHSVRRDRIACVVRVVDHLDALELGAVVRLQLPRYGYDAGRLMRVIGIQTDLRLGRAELTLWG